VDFALIKKHPVLTGASVIIGGLLLFALFRSGGSSADSGTSNGKSLAEHQLDAATGIQGAQIQAGLETAQLSANVANNQTLAQLEAVKIATSAQTTQQAADIAGTIALKTIDAETSTQQQVNELKAGLEAKQIESNTALGIVGLQVDAYKTAVTAEADIAHQQLSNEHDLQSAVIAGASRDKSRSSTGWTQILSALFGRGPEAIAANQPSSVASSPAGILDGIGHVVSGFFGG
jgi:hypothetical protein